MSALRSHAPEELRLSGQEALDTIQELNGQIEKLTARIEQYLAVKPAGIPVEKAAPRAASARCPHCNRHALRPSKRMTAGETLSVLLLMRPFRCRYCAYFEFRSMFAFSRRFVSAG